MLPRSYAHAARLPEGDPVAVDALVTQRAGPLEIEIGPGRGAFLYERLAARPDVRMIGLEVRLKWASFVDERLRAQGLGERGRVFAEDAKAALPRLTPEASVSAFFVHFPDPWWKKRHAKRLVVGDALLVSIARLLVDGGELFVQTDVEDRAAEYRAGVGLHDALAAAGDLAGSPALACNPYGARSNREKRADEDGLPVHRMRWTRRPR